MDLMSFDVRAVYEVEYERRLAELRQFAGHTGTEKGVARHDFAQRVGRARDA